MRVYAVGNRIANVIGFIIEALVEILFEWHDHEHAVYRFLDAMYAALVPGPNLRGNVIEGFEAFFLRKFCNPHIKTGVIYQNYHVRFPSQDILLALLQETGNLENTSGHFHKTHESHFAVMRNQLPSYGLHLLAAPETEFRFRILDLELLHQIGSVQVTR